MRGNPHGRAEREAGMSDEEHRQEDDAAETPAEGSGTGRATARARRDAGAPPDTDGSDESMPSRGSSPRRATRTLIARAEEGEVQTDPESSESAAASIEDELGRGAARSKAKYGSRLACSRRTRECPQASGAGSAERPQVRAGAVRLRAASRQGQPGTRARGVVRGGSEHRRHRGGSRADPANARSGDGEVRGQDRRSGPASPSIPSSTRR